MAIRRNGSELTPTIVPDTPDSRARAGPQPSLRENGQCGVRFDGWLDRKPRPNPPDLPPWSLDVSTTDDTPVTWLTQDAYDRLSRELDQLIANRPVMAKEINDRREEGDLKENGGYHAAREEQGFLEARIKVIESKLKVAVIVVSPVGSESRRNSPS